MGLPIWRDPEEKKCSRNAPKPDPTACLRSSIRRRPSVHGRRTNRASLHREPSGLPPRFERSPPPSVGFNGLRDSRRGETRGVPPISSLLEATERNNAMFRAVPPPPPVPESRNYWEEDANIRAARRRYNDYMEIGAVRERQRRRQLRQATLTSSWRGHRGVANTETTQSDVDGITRRSSDILDDFDSSSALAQTVVLNPREPLRILRSPEPMQRREQSQPRFRGNTRRSTLPTPPLETSAEDSLFVPEDDSITVERPTIRRAHPLSNAWRPDSPINGLGDRIRSPTPGDGWEVIRTTITPDESLPSAESSFTSAAASRSFNNSSNNSTQITEPDSADEDQENSGEEDQACTEEEAVTTEAFAEDIYFHEMRTPEGRERIARHQRIREQDGNRFALATEPARVDIGFRLIEEALESEEGRTRVLATRHSSEEDRRHFQDMLQSTRRVRERQLQERRARQSRSGNEAPHPAPEQYGQEIRDAVNETREQVTSYFRRYTADALVAGHSRSDTVVDARSPPPEYQARPVDGPLMDDESEDDAAELTAVYTRPTNTRHAQISQDGPQAHPVSPPAARSEREVSDALLSGDIQDLDTMRRVVERLAARDDVPEEWWMSMGLNLSRSRPQDARRSNGRIGDNSTPDSRVRTGRVGRTTNDRGSARL
ncbi:hypothetical protein Slin14017_G094480 [Septoria linicola]|nr:hypothetical protein Slin14017_G094480 [Septoria linicola]